MQEYGFRRPQEIGQLTRLQFDIMLDFIVEKAKRKAGKKEDVNLDDLPVPAGEQPKAWELVGINIDGLE